MIAPAWPTAAFGSATGVRQGLWRHAAAVKRTAKGGQPNGRNDGEGRDEAGGLVGAPPRSWRRQVRRRATTATLIATGHPLRSGPTSSQPGTWPHERCSRLSHNLGAVQSSRSVTVTVRE